MNTTCTIAKADDGIHYSITGPNGEEGDLFEYGQLATVSSNEGDVYYCLRADPQDDSKVFRVVNAEPVETLEEDIEVTDGDEEDEEKCECGADISDVEGDKCPVCGVDLD